ncbi:YjjG family noncanonical pyrimidine nucleotidase [Miniphocaeibacter halophilus]|uniref:YjjG family noncanonical pyrimidine nucleotidase n=1 Tax=Miniphocaeibacter halophilus TaxID=2931922 RepID=A0AC61MRV6_9FIRM|nr:YjjG family noncanonical pyrimidine nucleotidase [Miniphocaeibacter halophilus]QQK08319.1 YjjG family noncanonical pyrimidine nucleotidase [Miniphocaeibacter halophilus]
MYKALFFDIDDTIFDFEKCSLAAFEESFKICDLHYSKSIYELYREISKDLWKKQKSGEISVQDVLNTRFKILFEKLNLNSSYYKFQKVFEKNLGKQFITEPNVYEVISSLYKKYKIYAASNGILEMQINRLKHANLLDYFTDLFVSDDIGYDKPSDNFFKECLKRSNLEAREILFIGDSLQADIIGAKNNNIDTCWYNINGYEKPKDLEVNYIITNLIVLKSILL